MDGWLDGVLVLVWRLCCVAVRQGLTVMCSFCEGRWMLGSVVKAWDDFREILAAEKMMM